MKKNTHDKILKNESKKILYLNLAQFDILLSFSALCFNNYSYLFSF